MSYQEQKPLYTRKKSKNYKGSSNGNSKSLRKKDATQTVHHLLTHAEWRNSRRQTLKNMRTGNNEEWASSKRNGTKNKAHASIKRSREKTKCQGAILAHCMHTATGSRDGTHTEFTRHHGTECFTKPEQMGSNLKFRSRKRVPGVYGNRWRDRPLLRAAPEELGFVPCQDTGCGTGTWGWRRKPHWLSSTLGQTWPDSCWIKPGHLPRAGENNGNAQRNGNLGDYPNSFLPEKK